jgi:hypothetical protein
LEVEKVRWRVEQGEKLSRVLLRSYTILNFVISLGRAALGEILMLIWGATFGRNFGSQKERERRESGGSSDRHYF